MTNQCKENEILFHLPLYNYIHKKLNTGYCTPYTLVNVYILCTLYIVDGCEQCVKYWQHLKGKKRVLKINMNFGNRISEQYWLSN
jgi:hypothetical protein